jgi:hypothetical protein
MKNPNKRPNYTEKRSTRQWSDYDLAEFHQGMEKYKKPYVLRNGETVMIYDEIKFLQDHGALGEEGDVIVKNRVYIDHQLTDASVPYVDLDDKIRQWKDWLGRKEFGEKKKLEDLEKIAEGMTIDPNYTVQSSETEQDDELGQQ